MEIQDDIYLTKARRWKSVKSSSVPWQSLKSRPRRTSVGALKLFCLLQSSETTPNGCPAGGGGVPQVIWPSCSKILCLMGNGSVLDHDEWSNTVHMWADFSSKPGQSLDLKNWDMTATCWLIIDKLHSPISPAGGRFSFKSGHWVLGVVEGEEDTYAVCGRRAMLCDEDFCENVLVKTMYLPTEGRVCQTLLSVFFFF